jgi:diaminopimelate decarboxylase
VATLTRCHVPSFRTDTHPGRNRAALATAGAYGATMAGTYNSRPLVPEVLVDGDRTAVIRARQTIEELVGADLVPGWL